MVPGPSGFLHKSYRVSEDDRDDRTRIGVGTRGHPTGVRIRHGDVDRDGGRVDPGVVGGEGVRIYGRLNFVVRTSPKVPPSP